MQKNWIGKSFGCEIKFKVENSNNKLMQLVFYNKTRHFIWNVFSCSSVDHPLSKFYENDENFKISKSSALTTGTTEESIANAEKIGFKTDLVAINPLNKNIKVPVYFANFVLMDYGFGAVFGCPAHDQRDLDFAKKYKLKVTPVVTPELDSENFEIKDKAYTGSGYIYKFIVFKWIKMS